MNKFNDLSPPWEGILDYNQPNPPSLLGYFNSYLPRAKEVERKISNWQKKKTFKSAQEFQLNLLIGIFFTMAFLELKFKFLFLKWKKSKIWREGGRGQEREKKGETDFFFRLRRSNGKITVEYWKTWGNCRGKTKITGGRAVFFFFLEPHRTEVFSNANWVCD